MFQVIKQILILHNDNLSKCKIQFLNDENKANIYLHLCEKVFDSWLNDELTATDSWVQFH